MCQPARFRRLLTASLSSCPRLAVFWSAETASLSFDFPTGARYDVIVTQFGLHLCGLPIHTPGWRLKTS